MDESWANTNSQTHPGPNLGEATTFPIIVFYVHGHKACTQMSFCFEIPQIETSTTLEAHNFYANFRLK
jgi:hypothetical protein